MKKAINVILFVVVFMCIKMCFVICHETSHFEQCEIYNGEATIKLKFLAGETNCLFVDSTLEEMDKYREVTAHLEGQYAPIEFYSIVCTLLFIIITKIY
ncbi:MAG: hypothetical protein D4S01_07300 [Dehalococcoidia bacterium]|nr:MAG: hypothetical protein D4S01_07300 [Dehalococcoidia bacterium]